MEEDNTRKATKYACGLSMPCYLDSPLQTGHSFRKYRKRVQTYQLNKTTDSYFQRVLKNARKYEKLNDAIKIVQIERKVFA